MIQLRVQQNDETLYVRARWDVSRFPFFFFLLSFLFPAYHSSLSRTNLWGELSKLFSCAKMITDVREIVRFRHHSYMLSTFVFSLPPSTNVVGKIALSNSGWIVASLIHLLFIFFFIVLPFYGPHFMRVGKEKKINGCGELFTSVCQNRFPTRPSAPPGLLLFIVALNQQEKKKKISFTQSKWDSPSPQFFFFYPSHLLTATCCPTAFSWRSTHANKRKTKKKKNKVFHILFLIDEARECWYIFWWVIRTGMMLVQQHHHLVSFSFTFIRHFVYSAFKTSRVITIVSEAGRSLIKKK